MTRRIRHVRDYGGSLSSPETWSGGPPVGAIRRLVAGMVGRVNSYHHQGVRAEDLAPGLVASATASSPVGELVEGLETRSGRFVVGIQSHPERRDSTPDAFERLFRVFVDACRGAVAAR